MSFDVKVTQEARATCVAIRGTLALGQLLSLLQVLEVDCAHWAAPEVVLDLRELRALFTPDEQARVAREAQRRFAAKQVRLQWP